MIRGGISWIRSGNIADIRGGSFMDMQRQCRRHLRRQNDCKGV
jgi:hypothetical protein